MPTMDEVHGDDVVEQARHHQDQDAGDQRHDRLYQDEHPGSVSGPLRRLDEAACGIRLKAAEDIRALTPIRIRALTPICVVLM